MTTVQERVHELLAPIVATLDVELLDVEFTGGTLRVTIDNAGSGPDEGVTTQALAEVNRLISPILDQHDPVPGRYTLEVSSPGLERPLKRPGHYRRAIGEQVIVKLAASSDPRRVKGQLRSVEGLADSPTDRGAPPDGGHDDDPVELVIDAVEVDGVALDAPEERRISTDEVATARTVFEWGPGPKPGKSKKSKKNASKRSASKNASAEQGGSPSRAAKESTSTTSGPDHPTGSSTQGTIEEKVRDEQ